MMTMNMEYPNFNWEKFKDEVLDNGTKDPFGTRLRGIRDARDLREYFGLGALACDEWQLAKGYMSAKLHEALEGKLGKERLAQYFAKDGNRPRKMTREEEDFEDLYVRMFGTVQEVNQLSRARR